MCADLHRSGTGGRRPITRDIGDNVVPPEDPDVEQEPEPHEGSQAGAHKGRSRGWECPEPDIEPRGEYLGVSGLTMRSGRGDHGRAPDPAHVPPPRDPDRSARSSDGTRDQRRVKWSVVDD